MQDFSCGASKVMGKNTGKKAIGYLNLFHRLITVFCGLLTAGAGFSTKKYWFIHKKNTYEAFVHIQLWAKMPKIFPSLWLQNPC